MSTSPAHERPALSSSNSSHFPSRPARRASNSTQLPPIHHWSSSHSPSHLQRSPSNFNYTALSHIPATANFAPLSSPPTSPPYNVTQTNMHQYHHHLREHIEPIVLFFCDRHLRILRVNIEARHILGYSEHDLLRMTIYDLLEPLKRPLLDSLTRSLENHSAGLGRSSVLVSTVHPHFYRYAPPSMLFMATPQCPTYEVKCEIKLGDGTYNISYLQLYQSGAFSSPTSPDAEVDDDTNEHKRSTTASGSQEKQVYFAAIFAPAGYRHRLRERQDYRAPFAADLSRDPSLFTNVDFIDR